MTDAVDPTAVTTVTGVVLRQVVALGTKSERAATVVVVDGQSFVLRRRGMGAYDDDPVLAALAGQAVTLTGTRLSTSFLVDEVSAAAT